MKLIKIVLTEIGLKEYALESFLYNIDVHFYPSRFSPCGLIMQLSSFTGRVEIKSDPPIDYDFPVQT